MLLRGLYSLVLLIISPFYIYSLLVQKKGKPRIGKRWKELFGVTPKVVDASSTPIWIHAVSVGETVAATPLIKKILSHNPSQKIVLTTTTATGAEQAGKLGDLIEHRYMPLDFSFAVKGFLKSIQPSQLLIMETELWPNTLCITAKQSIPVTVVNARLSERSFHRYQKVKPIFNMLAQNIDQVLCQNESDAKRFRQLGVSANKIKVTGSVKFDIPIPKNLEIESQELKQRIALNRLVWIAASTHKGEDEQIFQAHKDVLKAFPDSLLIIVPRHPERFASVYDLAFKMGFSIQKHTEKEISNKAFNIYLGNTMGEMLLFMQTADVCFVGGSLLGNKVGGHNLLEPASLGKPIITGPSYFNFQDIAEALLDSGSATICSDSIDLGKQVTALFSSPDIVCSRGQQALSIVEANRGAVNHIVQSIQLTQ